MAKDWAYHGAGYMYYRSGKNIPPLLPWAMAMGYNFGLTPDAVGLFLGIILGSIMPLAGFWIVIHLFPEPEKENRKFILGGKYAYALLAAFLIAVHPFLIRISVSCLREIFYLPFTAFAIAFAVSAIHNKSIWRWGGFAGFAALANSARREGIIIIGIFFIWQLVEFAANRKNFMRNIKYHISTSCSVAVVFFALTLMIVYSLKDTACGWSPFVIKFTE